MLLSTPLPGDAGDVERCVRRFGLEGVVAKRRRSVYRGGRSRDWLKVRFSPRQEFVVGGYALREDRSIDALLVGYYEGGNLRYVGQVRNGLTSQTRAALGLQLRLQMTPRCPFVDLPHQLPYRRRYPWDQRITAADMAAYWWVLPALVIEVSYLGWVRHGLLREAAFIGIRDDKMPQDVQNDGSASGPLCRTEQQSYHQLDSPGSFPVGWQM